MVIFNFWPRVVTTRRSSVGALTAKIAIINDDKAERLIAGAAAYGSQLVVFPEAFVGGYPREVLFDAMSETQSTDGNNEIQKYHASAIDVPGPEVDRLAEIAGKYKVHLVIGVVERVRSSLFSAVLFFDSLGRYLGKHRKLMLMASECTVWCAGAKSSPPVYDRMVGRIGGLICWDNRMPLLRTELHAKDLGEILQAKLEFSGIGCNMGRTTCPKSGGPDLHEVKTEVDNVLTSND
ncbi:hypothetical protein TEA_022736 [Camellia sinensis var. sinensis]|uniref:CN hydrolase domain-containing protein n=1 Tax=Camellia sinensis var. sinensis TaxID=542762 RepID=A0A4S4F023_CAMSN|nr:hypothetical protein TEA_022736 [Camellia sinensis var. sinensis]